MRSQLFACCALLCAFSAPAQVSVREPATKAHLVNAKTVIALGLSNTTSKPLDAIIVIEWLGPDDKRHGFARAAAPVEPGDTSLDIALPLPEAANPLLERLRYEIQPASRDYTAFLPVRGMLSFPHIADYAFTLSTLSAASTKPGVALDVPVFTFNPVTKLPVSGVEVRFEQTTVVSNKEGLALLSPRIPSDPDTETLALKIEAHLGDFHQTSEIASLPVAHDSAHIYTDKPLYQPGQTIHIRILALSGAGPVRADTEHDILIKNENNETLHHETVTTSRFGIASTDWEIPANAKAGTYRIEVESEHLDDKVFRVVQVRRYELPSFRVSAKPRRPFYLLGEKAQVEIRGEYLFGKPLTSGTVRITEEDAPAPVAEGRLQDDGSFLASIQPIDEIRDRPKYLDRHFTAFVTDASTERTEERKFDVRVSRHRLHIYVVKQESSAQGARLYLSVYSPEGTPLQTQVQVVANGGVIGAGRTNRFGVARIDLPGTAYDDVLLQALAPDGAPVQEPFSLDNDQKTLWLDTDHALYRTGQAVRCHISAALKSTPVLLAAWNASGAMVYSKSLSLIDGAAEVAIPYEPRFGRDLIIGVVSGATSSSAIREVIYPGQEELNVRVTPEKATYRPGETATVRFHTSAASALGIAIVDQSLIERAATDQAFQHRRWFDYNDSESGLAGITRRDLLNLAPAKIDAELELLASALLNTTGLTNSADDILGEQRNAFAALGARILAPTKTSLDASYLNSLEYPRDEEALLRLAGYAFTNAKDPWMEPWYARFSTKGPADIIRFVSAGPDKKLDTEDDITGLEIQRKWFGNFEALIRERLKKLVDYPATVTEFIRALDDIGIRFEALRDPWGSPLRVAVEHRRNNRIIAILSAGPDRVANTRDDFTVAEFFGQYFAATSARIDSALSTTKQFPRTTAELRSLLLPGGIDFEQLRDPWGHPYYASFRTTEVFRDKIKIYTYSEYDSAPKERKELAPVKATLLIFEIRSAGPDGVPGTFDDFELASFTRSVDEPPARPAVSELSKPPSPSTTGTGRISGTLTDQSGASIPRARVELDNQYVTQTGIDGSYSFTGLKPGLYRLRFDSPGFQMRVIANIPVQANHVTRVDAALSVGAIAESVEVSSAAATINPAMAAQVALAPGAAISTPRVREYFPETLYWQPELITDAAGLATIRFKLADSITTWHVAAIASTVDGRITEADAELRAFQPFMVDLDVPPVLTVGDEIALPVPVRNFLDQPQDVRISASIPPRISLRQAIGQPGRIEPSSSGNALLSLRAEAPLASARLQVTGIGRAASDAIEKPLSIHPNGQRREITVNGFAREGASLRVDVPAGAIVGSMQAQVKVYPSLMARLLESMQALLERPWGCAEQTISSTYPNLLFLKALETAHIADEPKKARAMNNLIAGYQRLLGYQHATGGFAYWAAGEPDVALTAYALKFLNDAKDLIGVDGQIPEKARTWLSVQGVTDYAISTLQIGALAQFRTMRAVDIDTRLGVLARKAAELDDPYAIACFVLAAMDMRRLEVARPAIAQLRGMASDEQGAAFWVLRANTPFHGWGRAGQIETTALVVSALARWRNSEGNEPKSDELIDRGILFLLKNSASGGGWSTGQSTVRALEALMEAGADIDHRKAAQVGVLVNGVRAGVLKMPDSNLASGPVTADISGFLRPGASNEISFAGGSPTTQVQVDAAWYEPWDKPEQAKTLRFESACGPGRTATNQPVTCEVLVSRPSFRGYGMLIAEIGLPPGAELDRGTLASIVDDRKSGVDSFEVAPDHVTFYIWPRAADSRFHFIFRLRFAMKAQSAQSVLYDYYNPDERVVLRPALFTVE